MALSDFFNNGHGDIWAIRKTMSVLQVSNGVCNAYYDFNQRLLMSGNGGFVPFSQVDREVLAAMRDKLIELGGQPPELPPEAPPKAPSLGKFNL